MQMIDMSLDRRRALQGLLALSAAGAVAACSSKASTEAVDNVLDDAEFASHKGFFAAEEMMMLTAISDTIIPATDTPGAVAAEVPAQLQSLATLWADKNFRAYWRQGLRRLQIDLPDFANLESSKRETILGKYDASIFAGRIDNRFYKDMKSTIATAYYMSEIGATQELAYEPVPGEWKGCVPLSDYPKTWAT